MVMVCAAGAPRKILRLMEVKRRRGDTNINNVAGGKEIRVAIGQELETSSCR